MERQRVIYSGDRRFAVVMEERALHAQVGSVETMAGQLDRLLAVMSLPRVSLGIIPAAVPRTTFTTVSFWIYDNSLVGIETPTAKIEVTQPRELELYSKMFGQLREMAQYGKEGRTLVARAVDALGKEA